MIRAGLLLALALLPFAGPAQTPQGFADAKAQADRDEASLDPVKRAAFQQAQSRQLETSVANCADPRHDTAAFVILVEVDARGRIVRTWRQGDTALAVCVEKELNGRFLEPPPRAPFLAAFELSFTP
ncbi:hypothetical protein [Pseudoxanthomonas sp. z9]|uniref:hypothetical protein n=1 Tax=Pseudoxanthomonas sp. z9 TaxID=2584942 RepID=UPI0011443AC9|nr:hypothetical protein [Pseudoxanthomonas sp. z9]